MIFASSEGEPEPMKEATSDLHLTADGCYTHAQSTMGFLYGIGSGVEQSDEKAFLYHREIASNLSLPSQQL